MHSTHPDTAPDFEFINKYGPWALIAGASHGVGAAFAYQAAARGLNCILVARRQAALESLKSELQSRYGIEVLVLCQDLSTVDAAVRLEDGVERRQVGLMIYNAGGDPFISQFLNTSVDNWNRLLRMNTQTVMELSHAFGGKMVTRGRGGLILVGSHAALCGVRKLGMYSATKAFCLNFGESLWSEWKAHNVDVLNVLISTVDTPTIRDTMERLGIPEARTMTLPQANDIAETAFQKLAKGPTLVHPDDLAADHNSLGSQRRAQVQAKSEEAASFIGDD